MQKILTIIFLLLTGYCHAQTAESAVYDKYGDLNLALLESRDDEALILINQIMPDTAKLPQTARINFYNMVGKIYEYTEPAKAAFYYEKVLSANPDYYVAHRALGYIYLKEAQVAAGNKDEAAYAIAAKKVLPHLEKAEACDSSPETLETITYLYKKIKDDAGLNSLEGRLKQMAGHCTDLLEVQ